MCPYLRNGECVVALALRLCRDRELGYHGFCVVVPERCKGEYTTPTGIHVREWELCRFYRCVADCRYCQYFDAKQRRCRKTGRYVPPGRELGLCCDYEGPRPPPSIAKRLG